MISRVTSLVIATAYTERFTYVSHSTRSGSTEKVYNDQLYDFLYAQEYEAWFCNLATAQFWIRAFQEWFMKIHTGESFVKATDNWPWDKREKLGQRYLRDLALDHLRWYDGIKSDSYYGKKHQQTATLLLRRLELDGYIYKDQVLLQQQEDILNVEQEKGMLQRLFETARLGRAEDAFEFLRLGEEHFLAERWSDCISNVRKFFELTLREGAQALAQARGTTLSAEMLSRPVEVRQFLEREGLFERKERESLDKVYGLLSETGAHPYMAESDQARLLRQLSLTLTQFALLRLSTALKVVR
jgi:hypothetical protein